jgi:hypothetical protein
MHSKVRFGVLSVTACERVFGDEHHFVAGKVGSAPSYGQGLSILADLHGEENATFVASKSWNRPHCLKGGARELKNKSLQHQYKLVGISQGEEQA